MHTLQGTHIRHVTHIVQVTHVKHINTYMLHMSDILDTLHKSHTFDTLRTLHTLDMFRNSHSLHMLDKVHVCDTSDTCVVVTGCVLPVFPPALSRRLLVPSFH